MDQSIFVFFPQRHLNNKHGSVVAHLCFRWLFYLKTVLQKKKVPVNEIKAATVRMRMMSRWWY